MIWAYTYSLKIDKKIIGNIPNANHKQRHQTDIEIYFEMDPNTEHRTGGPVIGVRGNKRIQPKQSQIAANFNF